MTSKPVSALLADLGVTRSHSRMRVSNDNPYSEAQFKTLKYLHDFPTSFTSLTHSRSFLEGFFNEYNHIHRRSGIGWHTPDSVQYGTSGAVDQARQITLTAAYHANPSRFSGRPVPPRMPEISYINEPTLEPQINWDTPRNRCRTRIWSSAVTTDRSQPLLLRDILDVMRRGWGLGHRVPTLVPIQMSDDQLTVNCCAIPIAT
jgi:hypothetical protein